MKPDPVIDEIRQIRREISAEMGHDPRRLQEYYAAFQDRYRDRMVNYGEVSSQDRIKKNPKVAR